MIVDSHAHVWTLDSHRYPWQPIGGYIPELPADYDILLAEMSSCSVDAAVLVQPTPYGWDNRYLLDATRKFPDRLKAVCLVNPFSTSSVTELKRLVEEQGVSGLRLNWHLEEPEKWKNDPAHLALWSEIQALGIPVCIQLTSSYFPLVHFFSERFSAVRIVLDHLGRPKPGSKSEAPEFAALLSLVDIPKVYVKLSGPYYYSQEGAPYKDTWELFRTVVNTFSPQRCLWGSDFPFINAHWRYQGMLDMVTGLFEDSEVLEWLLGKTAANLWF